MVFVVVDDDDDKSAQYPLRDAENGVFDPPIYGLE